MDLVSDQLKKSGFETALNSEFRISALDDSGAASHLLLSELRTRSAPIGHEQFSLFFRGPLEPLLPQGTYRFQHPELGEMPLFMVPIGKEDSGYQYEVCISRTIDVDSR